MNTKNSDLFFVIQSEYATGIILNLDRTWNVNGEEYRLFFEEEDAAVDFAYNTVKKYPEIECTVMKSNNTLITMIDRNDLFPFC